MFVPNVVILQLLVATGVVLHMVVKEDATIGKDGIEVALQGAGHQAAEGGNSVD